MRKIYLVSNTKTADESVVNLSVSRIEFLKFDLNLSEFDALVATSKNAFKALKFNGISPINLPVFTIAIVVQRLQESLALVKFTLGKMLMEMILREKFCRF